MPKFFAVNQNSELVLDFDACIAELDRDDIDKNECNMFLSYDSQYSKLMKKNIYILSYDIYDSHFDDTLRYSVLMDMKKLKPLEAFEYCSYVNDCIIDNKYILFKYEPRGGVDYSDINGIRWYDIKTGKWRYYSWVSETTEDGVYFVEESGGVYANSIYFYDGISQEPLGEDTQIDEEDLTDEEMDKVEESAASFHYYEKNGKTIHVGYAYEWEVV